MKKTFLFTLALFMAVCAYAQVENKVDGVMSGDMTAVNKTLQLYDIMETAKTPAEKTAVLKGLGRTRTFQALLLAGKYLDDPNGEVVQTAAQAVIDIALSDRSFYGPDIRVMLNNAAKAVKNRDTRKAAEDYLIAMPTHGGFVSMFNGQDLSGWKGLVENHVKRSKMTAAELAEKQEAADKLMHRNWRVKDGILQFIGDGYDNLCSVREYGNLEMYVDWMIEPEGDAGVYLRGTPQVQIWDTLRRDVGAQVGSGGLYNNKTHRSTPMKVMDNPVGKWNTFYIRMIDNQVTVVFNGQTVVSNIIMENTFDRTQPVFPVEQIELQAHGTLVSWRNIYIRELPPSTKPANVFRLSSEEKREGYEVLFDGTDLNKWIGNTRDYVVDKGTIALFPPKVDNRPEGGGNLYTKEEFGDFVLRFEFMFTPGANNGLGIRTPPEGDAAYVGMELQIIDNDAPIYAELKPEQYHGSIYGIIPAERGYLKPAGEWNSQEVRAEGDNIKITLNGTVILDGNIREAVRNGTLDGREHPGLFNKSGHIGFLGHGSEVRFRDIRIKRL